MTPRDHHDGLAEMTNPLPHPPDYPLSPSLPDALYPVTSCTIFAKFTHMLVVL